jgi:hypothetical protein
MKIPMNSKLREGNHCYKTQITAVEEISVSSVIVMTSS